MGHPQVIRTTLLIIGAGPAGLAAAIDAKNSRLDFVIVDPQEPATMPKIMINQHQLTDGCLGFYNHTGTDLQNAFLQHLREQDIEVLKLHARTIHHRLNDDIFLTFCDHGPIIESRYVFIATGLRPRRPSMSNFDKFFDKNIFFFVDVDGQDLQDKRIGVLGGRNSGATAALYLQRHGNTVFLIEKQATLPAKDKYREQLACTDIKILTNVDQTEIIEKDGKFFGVSVLQYVQDGEIHEEIPLDFLFICIGMAPETELLMGLPLVYRKGQSILVNPETMETNETNLYAGGDVTQLVPKQVTNAAAHGKTAVYHIAKKEAENER